MTDWRGLFGRLALGLLAHPISLSAAAVNPSGAQPSMGGASVAELVDAPVFQAGGINAS